MQRIRAVFLLVGALGSSTTAAAAQSATSTPRVPGTAVVWVGDGEYTIPIECEDAADSNDDGAVDFSDAIYTLTVIFLGGTIPAPGTNSCGVDPTPDALDCGTYPVACP